MGWRASSTSFRKGGGPSGERDRERVCERDEETDIERQRDEETEIESQIENERKREQEDKRKREVVETRRGFNGKLTAHFQTYGSP